MYIYINLVYLLLIDKKAHARVITLFLRSCRIGLSKHFLSGSLKMVTLETPQQILHLLGQMIASPLFGWLYQKTGSARLVGLITSVAYIVGNILYSILSVFPEDYRYGLLLFSRFIVGVSSGIYFYFTYPFYLLLCTV